MEIRKAKTSDARGIIEVNVKTWCTTYSDIMPPEILQNRIDTIEDSIKKLEDKLGKKDNILVAIIDNKVVGIVSYGESKIIKKETTAEILYIYVLKEYQGKNIGKSLFLSAKNVLKEEGFEKMVVKCITNNPSNKFYVKMGGEIIDIIKSNIYDFEFEENVINFNL